MFATSFQRWLYQRIAKPIFFQRDPEVVHDAILRVGVELGRFRWIHFLLRHLYAYEHPALVSTVCGISFQNPVGLSAGFDKNAELTDILPCVGFGFEEIGSITGEPCVGNLKPRLWRLPLARGLVVYYGLKNDGCVAIAERLRSKIFTFPIGTNIAKTNAPTTVDLEAGIADYKKAFITFATIGAYFTINISCPNTFGGEPFAEPARLDALLSALDVIQTSKPIFLKISADISCTELDALVDIADHHRVHGFILSNLTKNRSNSALDQAELSQAGKGGISGKPTEHNSNRLITHLYQTVGARYVIIGVGGIFSAEDAYEKIQCGASLVQLITGMIFEGPQLIGEINRGLVTLLHRDGFQSIQEAVGSRVRKLS